MKNEFDSDVLMLDLHLALCQDMRLSLNIPELSGRVFDAAKERDIVKIRNEKFTIHDGLSPYTYKWCTQVNSLTKRYTFQDDVITKKQRESITNAKFIKLQETLASSYTRPRTLRLHTTLQRARQICRQALSGLHPFGEAARGRFGTKATLGCSAVDAYIDNKLINQQITGSALQVSRFRKDLPNDPLLREIFDLNEKGCKVVDTLAQVNVPKKFDIDRGINPNTLLGSLFSDRMGKEIEKALIVLGLSISRQQVRHGILAKQASDPNPRNKYYLKSATADLSDASHGFLSSILNALLPREWYNAIMYGVIRQVEVPDVGVMRLESIMTMGIGFTFPLQTLLFYCLLKALSDLTGIKGLISVYGDDLIYPTGLHKFVVAIFSDLGFKLNLDKTFVNSPFRESCGSDYFKGVAVRPYAPEGNKGDTRGRSQYAAFCYKLLNGLLSKWDREEIPTARRLLLCEITRTMGEVFIVPCHMPDHSGLKVADHEYHDFSTEYDWWVYPYANWVYCPGTNRYLFPHITQITERRFVLNHLPYYWDKLRSSVIDDRSVRAKYFDRYDNNYHLSPPGIQPEALFKWRPAKCRTYFVDLQGNRRRQKFATVALKELATRYQVTRQESEIRWGSNSL